MIELGIDFIMIGNRTEWFIRSTDKESGTVLYLWRDGTLHPCTYGSGQSKWLCGIFRTGEEAAHMLHRYRSSRISEVNRPSELATPSPTEEFAIRVNAHRPIYTVTSNVHGHVCRYETNRQLDAVSTLLTMLDTAIRRDGKQVNDQRRNS